MRYFLVAIQLFVTFFSLAANTRGSSGDYLLFEDQGKQGLKDSRGNIIIPARYEALGWTKGETEVIKGVIGFRSEGLWGLININNEVVTRPAYKQLYHGGQNLFIAAKPNSSFGRDYLGLISAKGHEVLPFKYAHIKVSNLRVIVAHKNRDNFAYGLLNLKGEMIIPLNYKHIDTLGGLRFSVKNHENKTAIFNDEGKQLVDFILDSISSFTGKYAVIYDNYKRGVISKSGQILLEPIYQEVFVDNNEVKARPFNEWTILKEDNTKVANYSTEELGLFSQDYLVATSNGRAWLVDPLGKLSSSAGYQEILSLKGPLAAFKAADKWGVINKYGHIKLSPKYDSVIIDKDMIMAMEKGLWSLYDTFNIRKTTARYEQIGERSGRLFPVKKNGHWGFIDRVGEEVIHSVYDHVGVFKEGMVWVSFHKEAGVIDTKGEWVVFPVKADSIKVLNKSYYISYVGGLKKLNHFSGDLIYFTDNDIEIKEGYLLEYISDGGIWKIDFSGRIVEEARDDSYQEVRRPSEGFYAIKKDGSYGFIDAQNRLRVANRYQDVGDFHEGLAAFKLLNKWGFMNKKEEIVIQPRYEKVSAFSGGIAIAYEEGQAGLIDQSGKKISSFQFDSLVRQSNGRFLAYKKGKIGLLDAEGKLMINAKYDYIKDLNVTYAIVGKSGKYGLVDHYGVNTIPMIYDDLIYDEHRNNYLALKKYSLEKVRLQ